MLKKFFLLAWMLLATTATVAQHGTTAWEVGVKRGNIFKHTPNFLPTVSEPTTQFELSWVRQPPPQRWWQAPHGYPSVCINGSYSAFGNAAVFGRAVAVVPALRLYSRFRQWRIQYDVGVGVAYLTDFYNRFSNPTNNVIGSHWNNCTLLRLSVQQRLNAHWAVQVEGSFTHFSNAHTKAPNLGINVPAVGVRLQYQRLPTLPLPTRVNSVARFDKRVHPAIRLGYGLMGGVPENGPKFGVYVADVYAVKRVGVGWRLKAGVETNYYWSIYHFIIDQVARPLDKAVAHSFKVAPYVGAELLLGRVAFSMTAGYYVYDPALQRGAVPSKMGLQYHFRSPQVRTGGQVYAGAYLKTHFANADFFEMGMGMVF